MQEFKLLLVAPVALLAQGYRVIFGLNWHAEMIHTAFLILVDPEQAADVNFALKGYDLVVLDDLLISPRTFSLVASTLKRLNNCPSVLVAGDNCQQHPL